MYVVCCVNRFIQDLEVDVTGREILQRSLSRKFTLYYKSNKLKCPISTKYRIADGQECPSTKLKGTQGQKSFKF